jgi:16S rRNA (guanine966-N2)-methyltransferase
MRIISGKFKGHRLVAFQADHIRPTTDRVKETIFNKLFSDLEAATVWDLFAGTGNLGLESISRGARQVIFVENSKKSLQILRQNLNKLKIEDGFLIQPVDVFQFLKKQSELPDLVFVDPPFTRSWAHDVMTAVGAIPARQNACKIIIESKSQERIDDGYGGAKLLDRKTFGDKVLSIFITVPTPKGVIVDDSSEVQNP